MTPDEIARLRELGSINPNNTTQKIENEFSALWDKSTSLLMLRYGKTFAEAQRITWRVSSGLQDWPE